MKPLRLYTHTHTHTHTSIYLDNKDTEFKNSLIVVPQNKKSGATFCFKKFASMNSGKVLNKIIYIVIALILVIICAVGAYWYNKNRNKVLNPIENSEEMITSGEMETEGETGVDNLENNIPSTLARKLENGDVTVKLYNFEQGEVIITTTQDKPSVKDARWEKVENEKEYVISADEVNSEEIYVWYKSGNEIELMSNNEIIPDGIIANYKDSAGNYYVTLKEAFEKAANGSTITVIRDNVYEKDTLENLQVGDYVAYVPETNVDTSVKWRVWKIDEENQQIIITSTSPLGSLTLSGATGETGWLNAETAIENECDKYKSSSSGVTADNVRSMKIEDIEEVLPKAEVEQAKANNGYGTKVMKYTSGTFYAEKSENASETFDGYNKALSSEKTATSSNSVNLVQTYWRYDNIPWNSLNNSKMTSDTYGTILGNSDGWLASRCMSLPDQSVAHFHVHCVSINGIMRYNDLYSSSTKQVYNITKGVRPLVSLNTIFFTGEGDGTLNNPWKLAK